MQDVSDELDKKYDAHIQSKVRTKMERDDRTSEKAVLCFDLENVIICPRANISNFSYKRKLNVYNQTAHMSLNKRAYNVTWVEYQAGRGTNEIVSPFLKIKERVLQDFPDLEVITSCIPQNRNSIMCTALQHFLQCTPSALKIIEQNFASQDFRPFKK